jgi:hypothetical protein
VGVGIDIGISKGIDIGPSRDGRIDSIGPI